MFAVMCTKASLDSGVRQGTGLGEGRQLTGRIGSDRIGGEALAWSWSASSNSEVEQARKLCS
jgi:hypothetical protein